MSGELDGPLQPAGPEHAPPGGDHPLPTFYLPFSRPVLPTFDFVNLINTTFSLPRTSSPPQFFYFFITLKLVQNTPLRELLLPSSPPPLAASVFRPLPPTFCPGPSLLSSPLSFFCEVPRGENMHSSGTDPESYITEYTLVYKDEPWTVKQARAEAERTRLSHALYDLEVPNPKPSNSTHPLARPLRYACPPSREREGERQRQKEGGMEDGSRTPSTI